MNDRPTYIASCSFGKDSLATILLALEHNEPLDRAIFCEVVTIRSHQKTLPRVLGSSAQPLLRNTV